MPKEKIKKAVEKLDPKQRLALLILVAVIIIGLAIKLRPPERSVTSFCKVYKEENVTKLTSSTDPHKLAIGFGRLEKVAPEEIHYDVRTLKSVFEKMDKDPTQQISAGLTGLGAAYNVEDWAKDHCGSSQQ